MFALLLAVATISFTILAVRPILMFACSLALASACLEVTVVVVVGGLVLVVVLALVVGLPRVFVGGRVCVSSA